MGVFFANFVERRECTETVNYMKNKYFIIIFFLILVSHPIQSQELFPISGYSPDSYRGDTQNWDICQSDNGVVYFANNKGLLEFNGAAWKLYPSPNHTIMRSVYSDGDRVYSGCYMEFGYWKRDVSLNMKYTSLSSKIKSKLLDDEQFWNIICYQKWVLFQSLHRIYIYDTLQNTFKLIASKSILPKMFAVRNQLYFQKMEEGIFRLENGQPLQISDNKIFKSNVVINIFPSGNKLLIETQDKGFYIYDHGAVSAWNTKASSEINSLSVYISMQLKNGDFALGTIGDGIYFLSPDGDIIRHIDKKSGLLNNTVLSMFEDADKNVWLGLDSGINILSYTSPFRIFLDASGTLGSVYAAACYRGNLYLGTNQGLFYRTLYSSDNFKFVKGTKGQVWILKVIDGTLFCGHNSGTFVISDGMASLVCNKPGTWDIKQMEGRPNLLLQGNYEGLNVLEKSGNVWHYRNKIEGFDISSRYFEQMPGQQIFVNHEYKGIYRLKVDSDFRQVAECKKVANVQLSPNSGMAKYKSDLLYFAESGFYKYDAKSQEFAKYNELTRITLGDDAYSSGKMIHGDNETLWIFTRDNVSALYPGKINSEPNIYRIAMPLSIRESMYGFENLLSLGNNNYLLGTTGGYIMFDVYKMNDKKYDVNISSVEKNKTRLTQNLISFPVTKNKLKSWENNVRFSYYVPVFGKYSLVKYQYRLEGLYEKWSNWTDSPFVLFNNLPSGKYAFKVRAKVGNTLSSNVASFNFTILRPWYSSICIKIVYALLVIAILFFIDGLYKRRYEKKEEEINRENLVKQLKSEQEILALKRDNLNNEIEAINHDLALSSMAVIKRDELLNSIKLKLQQRSDMSGINSVLKIIEENTDKNGGWKSFQDAFNNVDRDFLKKLKELHPALTPNDLKLCVYLRLNLSSKEIAPMLNISPQSVEIKRFRLRKKMELNHDENLTDYILNI